MWWTDSEWLVAKRMRAEGRTFKEITVAIGRSSKSVASKFQRHGVLRPVIGFLEYIPHVLVPHRSVEVARLMGVTAQSVDSAKKWLVAHGYKVARTLPRPHPGLECWLKELRKPHITAAVAERHGVDPRAVRNARRRLRALGYKLAKPSKDWL